MIRSVKKGEGRTWFFALLFAHTRSSCQIRCHATNLTQQGKKKEYSQLESNGVTNDSGNLRRGERQCTSLADRDDMSSCIDEGEREEGSSEGEQLHDESKLKEI